jgi:hypothetical protein
VSAPAPLPEEDSGPPGPFPGLSLSARQRRLYERLIDLDPAALTSLGEMYLGALVALDAGAPDGFAHAAHSSRELLEKLLRAKAPHDAAPGPSPGELGRALQGAWGEYKQKRSVQTVQLIDTKVEGDLVTVLVHLDQYREAGLKHKPSRRDQVRRGMQYLGLGDPGLPEAVREEDVGRFHKLREFFENAAHHGSALTDSEAVRDAVMRLEEFLMRLVPETFADMDEIDAIIGGSDA